MTYDESKPGLDPAVVCSLREPSLRSMREALARVPAGCALVEIRADGLALEEMLQLVQEAKRELIVTIRRRSDGGGFDGSEEERRRALLAALDAGARFIDLEWGSSLQSLCEGERAERVVLSHHGVECRADALAPVYRSMASTGAGRLKLVPAAGSTAEAVAVRDLLDRSRRDRVRLACFATGRYGVPTRLMAPCWGSWATYGSSRPGAETAEGQLTADDLVRTYAVLSIGPATRFFALLGDSVSGSPSPAMHNAGYREAGLDARFLPLEVSRLEECLPLIGRDGALGIEGLAVTIPFKERAAARCRLEDEVARRAHAVNTVLIRDDGWLGYNSDGPAVLDLVRRHIDPASATVAVVGAGGTARAAVAALVGAGSRVTVFNRTLERAEAVAGSLGAEAAALDRLGEYAWDLLVQATPLGKAGERLLDRDQLGGSVVVDAVYGAETPLVRDARARKLALADGLDLLVAQAIPQFERMTGVRPRETILRDAARSCLHYADRRQARGLATRLDGLGDTA